MTTGKPVPRRVVPLVPPLLSFYGVCSLSIFRLDFPPGGARLYPLAKLPAESGGRRRGDFCFGYSDLAIGAVGAGGELGGVRSRSWRDRAAQVGHRQAGHQL